MRGARRIARRLRRRGSGRGVRLLLATAVLLALTGCVPIGVRVQNMFGAAFG